VKLETLEQKRQRIATKLAREAANRRLINRLERLEYAETNVCNLLHPYATDNHSVGF
jgi:hypothetical protein